MSFGVLPEGFKRRTYLEILSSMESRAKELFGEDINLSDKSPLGMFLKAIAWEVALAWQELENSYLSCFSMDAVGNALDRAVSNFGRNRYPSLHSVGEVTITGDDMAFVPKGFLVSTEDNIMFETLEDKHLENGSAVFEIRAIYAGMSSNVPAGTIKKIVNPTEGISSVININETRDGSDIESDDMLRQRHFLNLRKRLTGDNKPQYEVWARNVEGVGSVKVSRATPTPGYVTLTITNANNDVPSQDLLDRVFAYIDELRPINAGVVVVAANPVGIDISANIRIDSTLDINAIKIIMADKFKEYFNSITLTNDYLSVAQVGRLILGIEGVIDYNSLQINGSSENIILGENDFPKIGVLYLEVF